MATGSETTVWIVTMGTNVLFHTTANQVARLRKLHPEWGYGPLKSEKQFFK